MTEKNRKVSYTWVKYGTGPLKDLYTVRRTVEEDFATFMTQADALAFIKEQEKSSLRVVLPGAIPTTDTKGPFLSDGRHYDSQGYCDNPGRGY